MDPLAGKYPWYTPYQFSGNKVIAFVELEGLEESITQVDLYYHHSKLIKITTKDVERNIMAFFGNNYKNIMVNLHNNKDVNWVSGKDEYFKEYNNTSFFNLWKCGHFTCHDTRKYGKLLLIQFHSDESVTNTMAIYTPDYISEAAEKAFVDIIEGAISFGGGVISESESVGLTSSFSYGAIVLGADQFASGFSVLRDIYYNNYDPAEGTDRRPLRNGMLTLFGKKGGKFYDVYNVIYNLKKGVFVINKAPNEVLKYFNEISRVNSAVSVKDGVISITVGNEKTKEKSEDDD